MRGASDRWGILQMHGNPPTQDGSVMEAELTMTMPGAAQIAE